MAISPVAVEKFLRGDYAWNCRHAASDLPFPVLAAKTRHDDVLVAKAGDTLFLRLSSPIKPLR
jgi:hypothetical protein